MFITIQQNDNSNNSKIYIFDVHCLKFPLKPSCCVTFVANVAKDRFVRTLAVLTAEEGSTTELPCGYDLEVKTVYWRKGNSSADSKRITTLYNNGSIIGPPGFDTSWRFNVTSNYSLVINGVRLEDEGLYFCQVVDAALDETFGNYTHFKVNSVSVIDTFVTGRS